MFKRSRKKALLDAHLRAQERTLQSNVQEILYDNPQIRAAGIRTVNNTCVLYLEVDANLAAAFRSGLMHRTSEFGYAEVRKNRRDHAAALGLKGIADLPDVDLMLLPPKWRDLKEYAPKPGLLWGKLDSWLSCARSANWFDRNHVRRGDVRVALVH